MAVKAAIQPQKGKTSSWHHSLTNFVDNNYDSTFGFFLDY